MTPKEKADELIGKYIRTGHNIDYNIEIQYAKLNALICVDEIINALPESDSNYSDFQQKEDAIIYWNEVKQEIKSL